MKIKQNTNNKIWKYRQNMYMENEKFIKIADKHFTPL